MLFETILYPTDFSDVSRKALSCIKQLKKYKTQSIIVLHVLHQRIFESLSIHSGRVDLEAFEKDLGMHGEAPPRCSPQPSWTLRTCLPSTQVLWI